MVNGNKEDLPREDLGGSTARLYDLLALLNGHSTFLSNHDMRGIYCKGTFLALEI